MSGDRLGGEEMHAPQPLPVPCRPSWDEYFDVVARAIASRASCPRASVGAVIVNESNHVIATGYNGAPPGEPHCLEVGCFIEDGHCQRAIHAEVNAVVHAERSLRGGRLYVTGKEVCRECAKVLRAAGVTW